MEEKKLVPIFYDDISRLIASYIPKKQLLPWIDPKKLDPRVSLNPNAIDFLKKNPAMIDWDYIISNKSATTDFFEKAIKKIDKKYLKTFRKNISGNPGAVEFLDKNPELIDWERAIYNPKAGKLFEKYFDPTKLQISPYNAGIISENPSLVDWVTTEGKKYFHKKAFSSNPAAVKYLEAHPELISKKAFSSNPAAVRYLKAHPELIDISGLLKNPEAIDMIEKIPDYENRVDWILLSKNPKAIPLLKKNKDKIDFESLLENPKGGKLLEEKILEYPRILKFSVEVHKNPSLVDFFRRNPDLINWRWFSENPGIFQDAFDPAVFRELQSWRRK